MRFSESQVAGTKACLRSHAAGEALLDFDGCFVTLRPGESVVVEKVLPVVGLVQGEAYTVYSRPDREKKRASRARWRYGTREELAESAFWVSDEEEEGGEEEWCRVDVSHVVRNRGWEREDMEVVVGNSVRFHVV